MNYRNKQCQKCFSVEMNNAVFCSQCGGSFAQTEKAVFSEPLHHKTVRNTALLTFAAISIFGLIVISAIFGSRPSLPDKAYSTAANIVAQPEITPEIKPQLISDTGKTIVGKVIGITDGDTVTILDAGNQEYKIRLQGVDAPEFKQDFGQKAKENLSDLIYGETVTVIADKTDKYGRLVGKILFNGSDINLEQIKNGFAWHYKKYAEEQTEEDRKLYADAELTARTTGVNLWSAAAPVAPWDFRNRSKTYETDKTKIFANNNSYIYFWYGCPGFSKIPRTDRVVFNSVAEAETAGYLPTENCSAPQPTVKSDESRELETLEAEVYTPIIVVPEYKAVTTPSPVYAARELPSPTPYPTPNYTVPQPRTYPTPDADSSVATAVCADGTLSYSLNRSGTCSHHGGVSTWLDGSGSSSTPSSSYPSSEDYSLPPSGSKTVNVRGYFRRDGTYVRPHTRSAPRRRN